MSLLFPEPLPLEKIWKSFVKITRYYAKALEIYAKFIHEDLTKPPSPGYVTGIILGSQPSSHFV